MGVAQLQVLGDEFHVDQATVGIFHIPDGACLVRPRHASTHVAHIGAQLVHIAGARQHGADGGCGALAQMPGPGDDACAGQGHVLPCPGGGCLVLFERGKRGGDGAGITRRAQAHVHLVQLAFGGGGGNGTDQLLRQAGEILARRQWPLAVRRAIGFFAAALGRVVIHEQEVEIRVFRDLAATQLAQGDHAHRPAFVRAAPAADAAMLAFDIGARNIEQRRNDDFRQLAQRQTRRVAIQPAVKHLHADLELLVIGIAAGPVQGFFEIFRPRQFRRQFPSEGFAGFQRAVEVARQHAVEQRWIGGQVQRQLGRRAHDLGHHR